MNGNKSKFKVPLTLSHKPIIAVENYDQIDGRFTNNTDAQCLSVGHAQYAGINTNEISAKVFRHTGKRWSPQSEELPLHRCIDLTNLIVQSIMLSENISYSNKEIQLKPQYIKKEELHCIHSYCKSDTDLFDKLRELKSLLSNLDL